MKILKVLYALFCLILLGYLVVPNFDFPKPPPDSLQSREPADSETPLRRAYFTNYTRSQVLQWYESQIRRSTLLNIPLPTYLLNYPPEDAQTIIRDQTRSTFLEEVVHPLRESVYINGFEPPPDDQKNAINIAGKHWRQKLTVRFVPSTIYIRLAVFGGIAVMIPVLFFALKKAISDLRKEKVRL